MTYNQYSIFFVFLMNKKNDMEIRKAEKEDIDVIMTVFDAAKIFMCKTGNDKQWVDGYPSKELILNNIRDDCF